MYQHFHLKTFINFFTVLNLFRFVFKQNFVQVQEYTEGLSILKHSILNQYSDDLPWLQVRNPLIHIEARVAPY